MQSKSARDMLGLAACLFTGALVASLAWFELSSVDLGYHLAYGRHFLDTGKIVEVDPYLQPANARPFINANWGSQVVLALVERLTGAAGLVAVRVGLIAPIFACIFRIVRRSGAGLHWAAWAWMLAALAGYERFSLRPELFSYAVLSLMLLVLTRPRWARREIVLLVVLQALWVNLHSYFLIGVLLTGCFALARLLRAAARRFLRREKVADAALGPLWLALALQLAATCANPWGASGAAFPIETLSYLRSHEAMGSAAEGWSGDNPWSAISEFKSPWAFVDQPINARTIRAFYVLFGVGVVGLLAQAATGGLGGAVATLLFLVMALQMRRNIAQLAFVASPLAAVAVASLVGRYVAPPRLKRWARFALVMVGIVACAWWTWSVVDGRFYFSERRVTRRFGHDYSDRVFARGAVRFLDEHKSIRPRLFVNYFASSNTLPWLPQQFKLFVDTNTFAYPPEVLSAAYDLGLGKTDHRKVFDDRGIHVALLHAGSDAQMLIHRLAADPDWALVYFDRGAVVFVRRRAVDAAFVEKYEQSERDLDAAGWIRETAGRSSQRAVGLALAAGVPISLGWHRAAIALCDEAVRLEPTYNEVWQYLGVCHGNLGNEAARAKRLDEAQLEYERALECFGKVVELTANQKEALDYARLTLKKLEELQGMRASAPAAP